MSLNPRLAAKLERQAERQRRMTMDERRSLAGLLPEGSVLFDEPMSRHSRSGAGGSAEVFAEVSSVEQLKRFLDWAAERTVDYRYWGRGSSVLIRDGGISGVLIKLGSEFDFARVESVSGGEAFIAAGGAVETSALARMLVEQGVEGAGLFCGFKGTLGGALCSRKDEKEAQISDVVEEVTVVTRDGKELTLRRHALRFENGRLKIPRTAAVVRALLKLNRIATDAEAGTEAGEGLPLPADGRRLSRVFSSAGRTAAGVLIDEAGLTGVRVGGARIAPDDANSIVNEGGAAARDVVVLISLVRDQVKQASGVSLDPMVEIVGER